MIPRRLFCLTSRSERRKVLHNYKINNSIRYSNDTNIIISPYSTSSSSSFHTFSIRSHHQAKRKNSSNITKEADDLSAIILKSAALRTRTSVPRPNPSLFYFSGLSNSFPVLYPLQSSVSNNKNSDDVAPYADLLAGYAQLLEDNYDVILKEYLLLRKGTPHSDYLLNKDEHQLHKGEWQWNSYVLKGIRQSHFASSCPSTCEILESIPLMTNVPFSYAFFSTLSSNSKIDSHFGPCNLRLRCHFPLIGNTKYF